MSIWKKLAIGCGGMIGLFVLTGVVITLMITLDRPEPGNNQGFTVADTLYTTNEGVDPFGSPGTPGKPVHLDLDVRFASIVIKRGEQLGTVLVEGNYDHGNFELKTEVDEKDDHINYNISFDSKLNFLATIYNFNHNDFEPDDNKITILLPADVPLGINFQTKVAETDMDLTGLAIAGLSGRTSMGQIDVQMNEPNPLEMKKMDFEFGTGEATFSGIENFRFAKGSFEGSMGELELMATGPLDKDTTLDLDFSMGGVKVVAPPDTNLDNQMRVLMGEQRRPDDVESDPNLPTLTVNGKVNMGEIRMHRVGDPAWLRDQAFSAAYRGNLDEGITLMRELKTKKPRALRPGSINSLGYFYLGRQKYNEAITVFQLNVELHPDYVNGYDSLGEGYYEKGEFEEAHKWYTKCVELDGDQDNAKRMLRKINAKLEPSSKSAESEEASAEESVN